MSGLDVNYLASDLGANDLSANDLRRSSLHREAGSSGDDASISRTKASESGSSGFASEGAGGALVNAFTIDVEDYFHVSALSSAISRDTWSGRELRVEANVDRLLAILGERGVRGTFFVLGWVADRLPQVVRRIAAEGHEVACHGYSHQLIYRQTPEEFREETVRAKRLLEDQVGKPVIGYRAASFSITPKSTWALDTLIELGFEYDSSIFPVRHDRYGMPGASRAPGPIASPTRGTIVEFPMSTAAFGNIRVPVSGGGYFRLLPYWFVRAGLKRINQNDGLPFTFYLHPWEVDPTQPRFEVSLLSRVRHYTNLEKCEARLRQLLTEFSFAPMRDVLAARGLLPQR